MTEEERYFLDVANELLEDEDFENVIYDNDLDHAQVLAYLFQAGLVKLPERYVNELR